MKPLFYLLVSLVAAVSAVMAEPALEVSFEEYDFGTVIGRATVYHDFWFKSVGTDTVRIDDIKMGCDCAMLPLSTSKLAPGDSMAMRFTWTTERAQGLDRRFPRIFTNVSPDPYRLRYYAMCVTEPDSATPVSIKPYRFEFAQIAGVKRDSLTFTITNKSDLGYAIHLVSPATEHLEVTFPDTLAPNASVTGHVRVSPASVDQNFEETLTFQFDSRGVDPARFSIPVRQRLLGSAGASSSR
ncbi:MAG: DUF1573 domain-containing protein [candidate division Zixibacteria bacterium]|jgi:hypothetical protein|nr:DUF1573 domain-containing protein [candidate division Zixibacteria bacterium]